MSVDRDSRVQVLVDGMASAVADLLPRRKAQTRVNRCEICGCDEVKRTGIWDRCPAGHVYVGKRTEDDA